MGTREENIFRAGMADQMLRYDDMAEFMKDVAGMGSELSPEERSLLSVAFKQSVATRRAACRSITHNLNQMEPGPVQAAVAEYRQKVENEMMAKSNEIVALLDRYLIPQASQTEAQVFYLKMKGDYYRYLAEIHGPDRDRMVGEARQSYEQASQIAEGLGAENSIRLGLALNLSVFYFEVLNQPSEACVLAKKALDAAVAVIGFTSESDEHKDSLGVMHLLKENLTYWDSGVGDGTAVEEM
eukprot:TRINITY_DN112_c0_g2_i3.p1 TRINITY_DN112_c0_g2~~TRINITY_DN112_c0_g2_i3.p1  ORF type:complete len:241 (-),score=55.83 TRINITY_DN112_c0_g2_i3:93-815(-)